MTDVRVEVVDLSGLLRNKNNPFPKHTLGIYTEPAKLVCKISMASDVSTFIRLDEMMSAQGWKVKAYESTPMSKDENNFDDSFFVAEFHKPTKK